LLPVAAIRRYAQLLERGAVKYGERNFEKGMPFSRYLDSAARHLFQALDGDTEEDHLAAVIFNVAAVMHHQDKISKGLLPKELDDVYNQQKEPECLNSSQITKSQSTESSTKNSTKPPMIEASWPSYIE
jgi:hypothetical protein